MNEQVDVILLSRDESELPEGVRQGLADQYDVRVALYRVIGTPHEGDPNRWATIARARNAGKGLGSSPWVMYLDDDVVLRPRCISQLVEGLRKRPDFAALAADYLGEMKEQPGAWDYPQHVGMGATLFRRDRLALVRFRWEHGKCECRCACEDLRRQGMAIGYLPSAGADHLASDPSAAHKPCPDSIGPSPTPGRTSQSGRVLAAFDRHHAHRFRHQFLPSFRASGNTEPVVAVAYGLYPSELRTLASAQGVEVIPVPDNGMSPMMRRVYQFHSMMAQWPDDALVAWWDAGDVLFQDSISPLWELVLENPDKLLVVPEPTGYPENVAIVDWTSTILDPVVRRQTFELLASHPFINSGFAAGTAGTLRRYLDYACRLLSSNVLRGTDFWVDQVVMNIYCHTQEDVWRALPSTWNYCFWGRGPSDFRIAPGGRVESLDGTPVRVVHGNGKLLRHTELSYLARQ